MNFDPNEEHLIILSADFKLVFILKECLQVSINVYLNILKLLFLVFYMLIWKLLLAQEVYLLLSSLCSMFQFLLAEISIHFMDFPSSSSLVMQM